MIKILATPMDIPPIKLEHRKTPALPVKTESFVLKKIRKVWIDSQLNAVQNAAKKFNERTPK